MPKFSLTIGNTVSLIALISAVTLAKNAYLLDYPFRIVVLIVCWFAMLYFSHCLGHYVVGRILGIRFRYYFLSKSMLSKAGIPILSRLMSAKVFMTLKLAERPKGLRGFVMFLAGPLASMFSPLVIAFIAGYDPTSSKILFALTIANAVFTGFFSFRHGCIRKAIECLGSTN